MKLALPPWGKEIPAGEIADSYEFTCAACGHVARFRPCLSMRMFGLNQGHGTCPECKTFLRLGITPAGEGASERWSDFEARGFDE